MNKIQYYILNKINEDKDINNSLIDKMSNDYFDTLFIYNYKNNNSINPLFTKDELYNIYEMSYNVLRFRVEDKDFINMCDNFNKQILCDQIDNNVVDYKYLIDHLFYLVLGLGNVNKDIILKSWDSIPLIQDLLIKKYNVDNSIKEYIERKVYTRIMLNVAKS